MNAAAKPKFAIDDDVLVDQGLPGKVASVMELPMGGFEYEVKPHDAGVTMQKRIPEHDLTAAEGLVGASPVPEGSLAWVPTGGAIGFVWPPDHDDIQIWAVDKDEGALLSELPFITIATEAIGETPALPRVEADFIDYVKDFLGFPDAGPTFHLGEPEVRLLTGNLPDRDKDAEMMLALDQRMRDWLAAERDPAVEPRPLRVLLLEAPEGAEPAEVGPGEAVQGSMELLADADEAYVFRGHRVVALKHRDRLPEDVHVAIQRRADDRVEFTVAEAQALADSFMGGSPDGAALNSATPKLEAILGKELG